MLILFVIELALVVGLSHASAISSCEQKLKQTQASLTEKMNQMIDALYSSSPLLSKLKPTNTTPASTTTSSSESPGDTTYEYAFASPYPVLSASPQVIYVAPPPSPATVPASGITVAASPPPNTYYTTLEPGVQPADAAYPTPPNSVAPRSVMPVSYQQFGYPTPQYTPQPTPLSFSPAPYPTFSTAFDLSSQYPTPECVTPPCTPAPLAAYPPTMFPQSFYQTYSPPTQTSSIYSQYSALPHQTVYQPQTPAYPSYPSLQSPANCIPSTHCFPLPLAPSYPAALPPSFYAPKPLSYPPCPIPPCIPYPPSYSYPQYSPQPEPSPQYSQ